MICPDCGHDNIPGVDLCGQCGKPLVGLGTSKSEVEEAVTRHPIGGIATKEPISVPGFTTVRAAIQQMADAQIGCLLVEDDGVLVGVFTERDVLNRILPNRSTLDGPVADYMTSAPETVDQDDSVAYALHLMSMGGYRHLPVADSTGRAAAIVSARDVLRYLAIRFAGIRKLA